MSVSFPLVSRRLRRQHREGGELPVGHHPADLWQAHPGQQRCQPVLLRPGGAHPARPGLGDVAPIDKDTSGPSDPRLMFSPHVGRLRRNKTL